MRTANDDLALMLTDLQRAEHKFPGSNWKDALSYGQLASKTWLIEELSAIRPQLGNVFVLGGWVGTLSMLMFYDERLEIERIRSFDLDPACENAADMLNISHHSRFKAITANIQTLAFDPCKFVARYADGTIVEHEETPDTIINTSGDHMDTSWIEKVPSGKMVVIQNNNYVECDETHTHTVTNLDEMVSTLPLSRIIYQGEMVFPQYTRYMAIGIR
jgi:hypothetical protein